MTEHWTDRLSEYLDGELPEGDARRLEDHLATCGACASTLAELEAVVLRAKALPDDPPARDHWPAIEARLSPRTAEGVSATVVPIGRPSPGLRRRVMLTVPQLAAAGIALVLFSVGGAWMALRTGGPPTAPAATAVESADPFAFAASWEAAVADLEAEFESRRAVLDPATIQVVERNLAIIDEAIGESRRALEADPSSGFLNGYLAEAMRRKVDLLRQATRIQRTET